MEEKKVPTNTAITENSNNNASVNTPSYQPPVQTHPQYAQTPVYNHYPVAKIPKPFYGFNIVALVLGIISLISGFESLSNSIELLFGSLKLNSINFESLGYYIADCTIGLIIAVLCLIFGFIGYRKKENYGRSLGLAGLICGGIAFLSYFASVVLFSIN